MSASPVAARQHVRVATTKQFGVTSADQGGGKRRAIIVMETHTFAKDS